MFPIFNDALVTFWLVLITFAIEVCVRNTMYHGYVAQIQRNSEAQFKKFKKAFATHTYFHVQVMYTSGLAYTYTNKFASHVYTYTFGSCSYT